jgi:glycosyltransferase involved in cell wall biosynthesis
VNPTWHIITGEYPPQPGGVSDYTRLVACGLAQTGDRVEVWAPDGGASGACDPGEAEAPSDPERVAIHRLPGRFGPQALWRLGRALDRFPAPRRLLVQYVPHAFGWRGGNLPFCLWLRSRRDDSIWVMFHEVKFVAAEASPPSHAALSAATGRMAALVAGSAERAFVSIPGWLPMLEPLLPDRAPASWLPVPSAISVVSDPPATAAVRARYGAGRPLIGHFGTFGRPTSELLEPVLAAIVAKSNCRVLLLGDGSRDACQRLLCAQPAFAGRLFATGRQSPADVSRHVSACDLMLQPYPDGISSRRTSAMVALAHGRPLVTTTGWLTEPFWAESHAVSLAPAGESDALAAAALAVLHDLHRRHELGRRAAALYDARFDVRHTIAALRLPETAPAASYA